MTLNQTKTAISGQTIKENALRGDTVGEFYVSDPDIGQTHQFVIESEGVFAAEGSSLVVDGSLDYESLNKISFTVTAVDDGIPPLKV